MELGSRRVAASTCDAQMTRASRNFVVRSFLPPSRQSQVHDAGAAVSCSMISPGRQAEPSNGSIGATSSLQSWQHT
jgi:hypothetical protein